MANGNNIDRGKMVKSVRGGQWRNVKTTAPKIDANGKMAKPTSARNGKIDKDKVKRRNQQGRKKDDKMLKQADTRIDTNGKMVKPTSAIKW